MVFKIGEDGFEMTSTLETKTINANVSTNSTTNSMESSVLLTPNYYYTGSRLYHETNDMNDNDTSIDPFTLTNNNVSFSVSNYYPSNYYFAFHAFDGFITRTDLLPDNQGWLASGRQNWCEIDFITSRIINKILIWNYRETIDRGAKKIIIYASDSPINHSVNDVFSGNSPGTPIYENTNITWMSQTEADNESHESAINSPDINIDDLSISARYIRIYVDNQIGHHSLIGLQEIQMHGPPLTDETVYSGETNTTSTNPLITSNVDEITVNSKKSLINIHFSNDNTLPTYNEYPYVLKINNNIVNQNDQIIINVQTDISTICANAYCIQEGYFKIAIFNYDTVTSYTNMLSLNVYVLT